MIENIIYRENYIASPENAYQTLLEEIAWLSVQARRKEAFMAKEHTEYKYIDGVPTAPIYISTPYHSVVESIQTRINQEFSCNMDLCFLNYYADQHQALGWHSDNSPVINQEEPIVVISLGEVRELWVRNIGYQGEVLPQNRFKLDNGSVFIMPPGFQNAYQHKIPKSGREMGGRISLTFRSKK